MSKRWKPMKGETYWVVCRNANIYYFKWASDYYDGEYYNIGNCFKTEAEAKVAAKKVKALLLSLHEPATECSRLPKLTTEVFDRPDCPEWARYAAVDSTENAYYYDDEPVVKSAYWEHDYKRPEAASAQRKLIGQFDDSDWKNSLIERPAVMPDWCKVGEWVYSTTYKEYVQISDIDEFDVSFNCGAYCSVGHKSFLEDYRPARLRQYTADEMRRLVGVLICKGPSLHFVTGYENVCDGGSMVHVNGCLYSANDLLRHGFTYDTRPCGKLEHLENGEWVE